MANLNKVMIIGNAGKDAEMRYTANGNALTTFSVAVNRNYRREGEWQTETEWFNVTVWGELGERVATWLTKGKQVYVEGRLQTRSWDNDEGVRQYRTDLVAQVVQALGRREDGDGFDRGDDDFGGSRERFATSRSGGGRDVGGNEIDPDDLPFE